MELILSPILNSFTVELQLAELCDRRLFALNPVDAEESHSAIAQYLED